MKLRRPGDVLRDADPNLKVIRGGSRRSKKRQPVQSDWEMAKGNPCSGCGADSLRLRDGLCNDCYNAKRAREDEEIEIKSEVRSIRKIIRSKR